VDALSFLHSARLKMAVRYFRAGRAPPAPVLLLLERASYRRTVLGSAGARGSAVATEATLGAETGSSGAENEAVKDAGMATVLARLESIFADIAAALEHCLQINPYHHRSVRSGPRSATHVLHSLATSNLCAFLIVRSSQGLGSAPRPAEPPSSAPPPQCSL
jgi:hypothetical protein